MKPSSHGLPREPIDLGVVVAEPAGRCGVGREAVALEDVDALMLAPRARLEDGQRLGGRQRVVDVGEVDLGDDLLGRE